MLPAWDQTTPAAAPPEVQLNHTQRFHRFLLSQRFTECLILLSPRLYAKQVTKRKPEPSQYSDLQRFTARHRAKGEAPVVVDRIFHIFELYDPAQLSKVFVFQKTLKCRYHEL